MNRIYLITDTHFNHKNIIDFCGRPENYEQLLFSSMQTVPEDSILLHLGDICMGRDEEVHKQFIEPLKCKKWLVRGNHDRKSDHWYYEHGWDVVCESINIKRGGNHIVFSHKPVTLPVIRGRFPVINIHGHFHNTDHRKHEPEMSKLLTDHHHLLAVEYTDYQIVSLDKFIIKKQRKNNIN